MFILLLGAMSLSGRVTVNLSSEYGITPGDGRNVSARLAYAFDDVRKRYPGAEVEMTLDSGRYDFYPEGSLRREYYISNHDQTNPKSVGIAIENWDNVGLSAPGADFVFHGRMLPLAVTGSANCRLSGFSIDFENPHICQVEVLANDSDGIVFRTAPWVRAEVRDGVFTFFGEDWSITPRTGIAFEGDSRHIVYRTSDLVCPLDSVITCAGTGVFRAPKWTDERLLPGTVIALRGYGRPAPGIFLSGDSAVAISDVKVHYAEGMGLLAQLCDGITLERFGVCRRGDDDPRYFTTQADATHFSSCKGAINSVGGLYEGMMDDAINVHGTYLKITERRGPRRVLARYMHPQTYGFKWGDPGDSVQIVRSATMEAMQPVLVIAGIRPSDREVVAGAKEFEIEFTSDLPAEITPDCDFGLENLTWTPEVHFSDNVVRNNRARGALFSTPRHTVVERNLFDHTSGTAILLCGDCMGWYETGACRDVVIRKNRFVNALTNMFQFTEAVISIYPEIHRLEEQKAYFHSGIVIEDNEFESFDIPLLYAKSTDGLIFRRNRVKVNNDYPSFHRNAFTFKLQRCRRVDISDNDIPYTPSVLVE